MVKRGTWKQHMKESEALGARVGKKKRRPVTSLIQARCLCSPHPQSLKHHLSTQLPAPHKVQENLHQSNIKIQKHHHRNNLHLKKAPVYSSSTSIVLMKALCHALMSVQLRRGINWQVFMHLTLTMPSMHICIQRF